MSTPVYSSNSTVRRRLIEISVQKHLVYPSRARFVRVDGAPFAASGPTESFGDSLHYREETLNFRPQSTDFLKVAPFVLAGHSTRSINGLL